MKLLKLPCLLLLVCLPVALRAAEPVVLVTVKPLAWLVAALAPPGSAVEVLVPAGQSPHDFQLRPSDMARIRQSALLVWIGPGMEPGLAAVAQRLPPAATLALLPESLHGHGDVATALAEDPHLWLDPLAMSGAARLAAERLKPLYPGHVAAIDSRLAQFDEQMRALDAELLAAFAPAAGRGFVVYHDGYQRLVQRYHLDQRAAVWRHEGIPPGARERAALLDLLASGEVHCLFYEPEHGAEAIGRWLGSAAGNVQRVELDLLGSSAADYTQFLRGLAGKMTGCLAAQPRNNPDKP